MIEKDLYKPPPSFPCMASLQWRAVGALCLQPSWGADIASPNTDIPATHPFSVPSQYIPIALLIWLHFCLMLANLQWVPRGLGISILLAYGRLCLCQPLSRPPALFPPQTTHYCPSAVQPANPAGNPTICWEAKSPGYHFKECEVRRTSSDADCLSLAEWPWWDGSVLWFYFFLGDKESKDAALLGTSRGPVSESVWNLSPVSGAQWTLWNQKIPLLPIHMFRARIIRHLLTWYNLLLPFHQYQKFSHLS